MKRGQYGNGSVYQPKHAGETRPPADRNWYVTWYDKDGVKQRATKREDGYPFATEREAKEYLKLKLADAIRGIAPANNDGKTLRYADLRELVLKHNRKHSNKQLKTLSRRVRRLSRQESRRHVYLNRNAGTQSFHDHGR